MKLTICLVINLLLLGPLWATTVEKSPNDRRDYAAITLENGLLVLLISDPDTDQAAAAMDISHGSWSEPAEFAGLAHLLEHMLFLGTEPFPESDAYQGFISRHGGSHNAYTSALNTNYFFSIDPRHLRGALARFAPFFYAPLLDERFVEQETQVVDAEFRSKLQDENWRFWSLEQVMANPMHPASRFTIGNSDTLQNRPEQTLQAALREFFDQHYSTNHMALVILGRETTEELAMWATELFAPLVNRETPAFTLEMPRYVPPKMVKAQALKETHRLSLRFPLPPLGDTQFHRPGAFISSLLGDEGPGSLLSLLKAQGWAESLSAGVNENELESMFSVNLTLTPEGVTQVTEIVDLVFQTLDLIEKQGIEAWRYDEMAQLSDIAFQFQEAMNPMRYVSALAANLRRYGSEQILRVPFIYAPFDEQIIRDYLAQLTPDNLIVVLQTPMNGLTDKTPFFEVAYQIADAPLAITRHPIHEALALPRPNAFIPENLTVRDAKPDDLPVKMPREIASSVLWYLHDNEFQIPRGDFFLSIRSPVTRTSAAAATLTQLYAEMVEDELSELTYPASLAGLNFRLTPHGRGLTLQLSGFDEKQPILLERIIETLISPEMDAQRFSRIQQDLMRRWRNSSRESPHNQAISELYDLLLVPRWSDRERLRHLQQLTLNEFAEFVEQFQQSLELVQFVHGNFAPEQAKKLATIAEQKLLHNAKATKVGRSELIELAEESVIHLLPVDHNDGAVVVYYQGSDRSHQSRAKMGMLAQILETPFYQSLRTEQQLGYVVFAVALPILEVPGMAFIIQSPHADGAVLQQKIDLFLQNFAEHIEKITPEEFAAYQSGLTNQLRERDQNLRARSNRLWRELELSEPQFDTLEQLAQAVETLTLADVATHYQTVFADHSRRLTIMAVGRQQEPLQVSGRIIADPERFKRQRPVFPEETAILSIASDFEEADID